MLPFVFDVGEKKGNAEESGYDPAYHQREMEEYFKEYEQKQVNSRFYRDKVGLPNDGEVAEIRKRMNDTEQAIQRLNEEQQNHIQMRYGVVNQPAMNPLPMVQPYPQQIYNVPPPQLHQIQQYAPMAQHQIQQVPHDASQRYHKHIEEERAPVEQKSSSDRRRSRSSSWTRSSRRSRSRSRDRRRRSRSKSRSRSRDRHHRRRRDHRSRTRSRSPSSSHYKSSRSSKRRRSRSSSRDKKVIYDSSRSAGVNTLADVSFLHVERSRYEWHPGTPCNKLAILNMPNDVDNAKVTFAFGKCGYLPQDVRTMTKFDKVSKLVKTFAFVEFADVATAEKWMQENEGWLVLEDGRQVVAEYAKEDPAIAGQTNKGDDWICAHCSMNNFMKRQSCFKCEISKEQSMELEKLGAHMVGIAPCDTLLIRGLPENCENTAIFDSLSSLVCLNSISMIKLSESKRFAYVQMKSADEATMLLNMTYKSTLKVRNKDVQVSYCRDSMTKLIQQQMSILTKGNKQPSQAPTRSDMTGAEIAQAAIAKAQAVRQASHQVGQMMSIPPPNMMHMMPPMNVPPPQVNTEVKNGIIGISPTPRGVFPRYVAPNPMTFVPDTNSGYYIDPITNFFYDSKTGYYFNNETAKWSTWDVTYQTYFPVEEPATGAATVAGEAIPVPSAVRTEDVMPKDDDGEGEKKEAGPKTAADVAKDMAKWAKKQEKDKKKVQMSLKASSKSIEIKNVFNDKKKNIIQAEPVNGILDDDDEESYDTNIDPHTGKVRGGDVLRSRQGSEEFTSRKGPSAVELREAMERALIDESKKMCLLCKRAFPSVDVLRKHVDKSELHRTNLEKRRIEWGKEYAERMDEEERQASSAAVDMPRIVYRDRAKERRRQYGIDATGYAFDVMGAGNGRSEDIIRKESEEASTKPLDDTNIGNRLLKSMGWKEGQGVGKNAQGIVNPIQAERFVQGAGLGSSGSKIRGGVEASHKEKTRQALFSRYNDS